MMGMSRGCGNERGEGVFVSKKVEAAFLKLRGLYLPRGNRRPSPFSMAAAVAADVAVVIGKSRGCGNEKGDGVNVAADIFCVDWCKTKHKTYLRNEPLCH